MRNILINFTLALILFASIFVTGTLYLNYGEKNKPNSKHIGSDSIYVKAFQNKANELKKSYSKQINLLTQAKDSLQKQVKMSRKAMSVLSVQSKLLKLQITEQLNVPDSTCIPVDSIKTITLDYIAMQQMNDSLCNTTIQTLELMSIKQDSIIGIKNLELDNYKEQLKMNELREQQLTEALNTAYKVQRKAVLKSKICAGAMILISGFSSALLINQTVK